jgi:hypothetical protein
MPGWVNTSALPRTRRTVEDCRFPSGAGGQEGSSVESMLTFLAAALAICSRANSADFPVAAIGQKQLEFRCSRVWSTKRGKWLRQNQKVPPVYALWWGRGPGVSEMASHSRRWVRPGIRRRWTPSGLYLVTRSRVKVRPHKGLLKLWKACDDYGFPPFPTLIRPL